LSLSQPIIWTHEPFSLQDYPVGQYGRDTIVFDAQAKMWGIVHLKDTTQSTIKLKLKSKYQVERTFTFRLQPFAPNQLQWHPSIQKWWQPIINSNHWYYFQVTPQPTVPNAYDGVALLDVFADAHRRNNGVDTAFQLYYKKDTAQHYRTLWMTFGSGGGFFDTLFVKHQIYKELISQRKDKLFEQATIQKKCYPPGFEQVDAWAKQKQVAETNIQTNDYHIFAAVEKMKVLTESLGDSIAAFQKRQVRRLYLLDLNILEATTPKQKSKLKKQRANLLKRLSIYPKLTGLLTQYQQLISRPRQLKSSERNETQKLQQIKKAYKKFKPLWERHHTLEQEIKAIDKQLEVF